jgi:hypothetical protein
MRAPYIPAPAQKQPSAFLGRRGRDSRPAGPHHRRDPARRGDPVAVPRLADAGVANHGEQPRIRPARACSAYEEDHVNTPLEEKRDDLNYSKTNRRRRAKFGAG